MLVTKCLSFRDSFIKITADFNILFWGCAYLWCRIIRNCQRCIIRSNTLINGQWVHPPVVQYLVSMNCVLPMVSNWSVESTPSTKYSKQHLHLPKVGGSSASSQLTIRFTLTYLQTQSQSTDWDRTLWPSIPTCFFIQNNMDLRLVYSVAHPLRSS